MLIGKKISKSQIIGIDGENDVKCWLSKSCQITASKLENDFGIDFIGQWCGASTNSMESSWWVNPIPISIAVRATTSNKGKIIIDKADATVLLNNPCIFLVIPHSYPPEQIFYAKFVTPEFVDELNTFIKGSKEKKVIAIKNCISDITEINNQIQLLLSPAYAEKIKIHKIRIGLQNITPSGEIIIQHGNGDSRALISTGKFSDFFSHADDNLKQSMVWGSLKHLTQNMNAFNDSRKFKNDFTDFLHSLPVKKAIIFSQDSIFQDCGVVRCKVQSKIDSTEAFCDFSLRHCDTWIGLWHPVGLSIKMGERKQLPDGTHVHDIESFIDPSITFSEILADKELCVFLQCCRNIDSTIFGDDFSISIRLVPDFYNAGVSVFLYEELFTRINDVIPAETKLSQITDEDLFGLSMLYLLDYLDCIGDLELHFTKDTTTEIPIYNIESPLCFNILGHGIICWLKRSGHLLLSEKNIFVGIKLGTVTGFTIEKRDTPFTECHHPFIGIRKEWPVIAIFDEGHAHVKNITIPDDLQMKFSFEK